MTPCLVYRCPCGPSTSFCWKKGLSRACQLVIPLNCFCLKRLWHSTLNLVTVTVSSVFTANVRDGTIYVVGTGCLGRQKQLAHELYFTKERHTSLVSAQETFIPPSLRITSTRGRILQSHLLFGLLLPLVIIWRQSFKLTEWFSSNLKAQ